MRKSPMAMYQDARRKRLAGEGGFTLIELLVVVVIIGILVAIAIPLYLNYRKGAANKATESDVRGAVSAVEQCFTQNANAYPASVAAGAAGANMSLTCTGGNLTATVSSNTKLAYNKSTDGASYTIVGTNSDKQYTYDSTTGKIAEAAAPAGS